MKRAPSILTLIVISALFGYGFLRAGQIGWQQLQDYPGTDPGTEVSSGQPGAEPAPSPAAPRQGGSPRLLMVLVDGVSAGDAIRLPTLVQLADSGAAYTLTGPVPAWPAPSWSTLFTGRSPNTHGVLLATETSPPAGDDLLEVLSASGLRVALVAEEQLLRLFGANANAGLFPIPAGWEGTGAPLLEGTDRALATGADVVVVHLGGLHTVAHRLLATGRGEPVAATGSTGAPADGAIHSGAAKDAGPGGAEQSAAVQPGTEPGGQAGASGEAEAAPVIRVVPWDEALGWTDARLALLLARVDRSQTTVVAVAPYGATPEGEHGAGGQMLPLVISGPLAGTARGRGDLRDVAPTVAALLGVAYRTEGSPLPGALAGGLKPVEATTGAEVTGEIPEPGPETPGDVLTPLRNYWAAIRPHLWPALAVLVFGAGYLWLSLRQPYGRLLAATGTVYLILYHLSLLALGFRFRPDLPALEEPGWAVLRNVALATAIGMLPAGFLVGLGAGRRGRKPDHSALLGIHLALCLMTLLVLSELPVVIYTGWMSPVRWPGHFLAIRFFTDMAQGAVVGFAAPLWAAATALGAALGSSLWPVPREPERELRVVAGSDWHATRPRASGRGPRATGGARSPRTGGRRR